MDPKKNAIDELMKYLDQKDGDELGEAMKPKAPEGIEIAKVKVGDDSQGDDQPSAAPGAGGDADAQPMDGDKPQMSDDEIQELIEMLQQKLGS